MRQSTTHLDHTRFKTAKSSIISTHRVRTYVPSVHVKKLNSNAKYYFTYVKQVEIDLFIRLLINMCITNNEVSMVNKEEIHPNGMPISIINNGQDGTNDFMSLTDIAKTKNPDAPTDIIKNWLRAKSTIEFLGLWEQMNNNDFNIEKFSQFKNDAGSNAFVMSSSKWIKDTNARGIIARSGIGGGTFAHTDIAFEFASWISPEFRLYLIKDYQQLKLSAPILKFRTTFFLGRNPR